MIVGLNIFRFCMRAKLRARQKCNTNSSPECSHRQKRHRASLRRALFLLSPMFLHAIVPSPKMDSEDLFSLVFQFQATHFFPNLFISQLIPFAPLRAVLALQRAIRGRIVLCLGGEGPEKCGYWSVEFRDPEKCGYWSVDQDPEKCGYWGVESRDSEKCESRGPTL